MAEAIWGHCGGKVGRGGYFSLTPFCDVSKNGNVGIAKIKLVRGEMGGWV